MNLGLQDKVAFVAGSSRGIGLAIAREFLREGARVVVTGRTADKVNQTARSLGEESGHDRILSVCGDLTQPDEIRKALRATQDRFGGVDAVVANVGKALGMRGSESSPEEWDRDLRQNLLGSMALASAALPVLSGRSHTSVTFISSICGVEALPGPLLYSTAKAALLAAMKLLACEAGPKGVRVNAVAPGNILFVGGGWEGRLQANRAEVEAYIQREVPLRRFGTPEEIAAAVVFLSSERASFVSGACVVADGGQTRTW